MSNGKPSFTKEEEDKLRHEAFIDEVLKRRSKGSKKPNWQIFLESSGGVAVITLLLGGAFSTWITNNLQEGARRKAFQNEFIKMYSQHRLASEAGFLEDSVSTLKSGLELLGTVYNHTQGRIDIDSRRFADRIDPEENRKLQAQKEEIRKQFNATIEVWDAKKGALEPVLGLYFGQETRSAWRDTVSSLDEFAQCASRHRQNPEGNDLCKDRERSAAEGAVTNLIDRLSEAPSRKWLSREDVAEIRTVLSEAEGK